jgi:hypothetical protein
MYFRCNSRALLYGRLICRRCLNCIAYIAYNWEFHKLSVAKGMKENDYIRAVASFVGEAL